MVLGDRVFYALTQSDRDALRRRDPENSSFFQIARQFPAVVVGSVEGSPMFVDLQVFAGPATLFRRGVRYGDRNGEFLTYQV